MAPPTEVAIAVRRAYRAHEYRSDIPELDRSEADRLIGSAMYLAERADSLLGPSANVLAGEARAVLQAYKRQFPRRRV